MTKPSARHVEEEGEGLERVGVHRVDVDLIPRVPVLRFAHAVECRQLPGQFCANEPRGS